MNTNGELYDTKEKEVWCRSRQSATFNDATGNITSTVTRTLKLFRISSGAWGYVQDLTPGSLV